MTEYGIVPEGFRRKPIEVISEEIRSRLQGTVSGALVLTPVEPLGAMHVGIVDALDQLWGIAEQAYHGTDPARAMGQQVVYLGKLLGRPRGGATKGLVNMRIYNTWPEGTLIAPGSIQVCVEGNTANSWTNRDTIKKTGTTYTDGKINTTNLDVVFDSTFAGAAANAAAGQITQLVASFDGIQSVVNPTDAEPGKAEETIEELRQAVLGSQTSGDGTARAIIEAVGKIEGVQSVTVRVNRKDTHDTIPQRSIEILIWDGEIPAASDAEIFATLAPHLSAGDQTFGEFVSYIQTGALEATEIRFNRAKPTLVTVTVQTVGLTSVTDLKNAIVAMQPKQGLGLYSSHVITAAITLGATDVLSATFSTGGGAPVTSMSAQYNEILLLDSSRIIAVLS
jgi:hypothetical protein